MPVFHHVRPPSFVTSGQTLAMPCVFLAGTIDMGASTDWQQEVVDHLHKNTFHDVVVYNPRRADWDSSWKQDIENDNFRAQVVWELEHIEGVDHILVHFEPTSKSPVTLLELGYLAAYAPGRVIVSCPDGYWRRGNVQIVCDRYDMFLTDMLGEAVAELIRRID